ncbi:MAG: murein DD-endopeptidase MepM/ murein hydrolase activator NlpD [Flavobacteriales bacterium]|jgi:murein DD-endopeptidase MepM/ murein hydrolase activator NlpD
MARYRYKYNPEQLKYEKVPFSWKDYFLVSAKWLSIVALVAFGSIFIFNRYFESPKMREQKRELVFLDQQLNQMQSELLNMDQVVTEIAERDDDVYRNIFGAEPFPKHLRQPGIGGTDRERDLRGFDHSGDVIETKRRISQIQRKLVAQSKSFEELFELARTKEEMLSSIPAIQPVRNEDLARMASGFGYRIHPIYKVPKFHAGMDFTASTGTEIFATGDGVIERVERRKTGYGLNVIIRHGYGYKTLYGHMSQIKVREGQRVKRGDVIGLVGNTGTSVGPHLHYEVIKDGAKVNPAHYYFNDLTPEQFEIMLELSSSANQSFD